MKNINPIDKNTFPIPDDPKSDSDNSAVNLIRSKLDSIYNDEPDVVSEAIDSIQEPPEERSKHQRFMASLVSSGKSFAEIQTEWHNYYVKLPASEKHEVWNEFYSAQGEKPQLDRETEQTAATDIVNNDKPLFGTIDQSSNHLSKSPDSVADLKKQIRSKVKSRTKLSKKQHISSLLFGLSAGAVTVAIMLFSFFNERVIAPFITPSRTVSSTPLITDGVSGSVGKDPKLIIPKINVELPVVYDVKTINEDDVQSGLERGVVHYATTSNPGELGNGAIFGHSSNNILNRGQYKFAFVLLNRLEDGDTFYLEKDGVRYVYRIFKRDVVKPSNVDVLNDVPNKASTMALITCDPPGTTINRLVVWGEQISPDPSNNGISTAIESSAAPQELAGNAESLWSRIWQWIF